MKFDLDAVKRFIESSSKDSTIYIGADSTRYKHQGKWYARYCTVVVVHYDTKHGGKVFGRIDSEPDYDKKLGRPALRMMNEVYRASQMFMDLEESIGKRKFEIHVDINSDVMAGSNCALQQAIGYIKGSHGVEPVYKNHKTKVPWAASFAADRMGNF